MFSNFTFSKEVNWTGIVSQNFKFEVPAGVKGVLVSVEYKNMDSSIMIKDLTAPDDTKYIKSNAGTPMASRIPSKIDTVFNSKIRMTYVTKGKFAAFINGDVDAILPGEWILRLANQNKKIKKSNIFINVKYLMKNDSDIKSLHLDIDVNADIAESSISKLKLSTTLERVKSFFKIYGIAINFHVNDAWRDTQRETSDLEEKIELLQTDRKNNLQLYLLKRQSSIKRELQGVAGCFPFVIIENTNQHCSVIVAYENQDEVSIDKMTKVIAHEILHSLGLFHLSDDIFPFGLKYDAMDDTNEETDHTNVMHKKSDFFGSLDMSEEQAAVVRSNIILQRSRLKDLSLHE
jgi:hypothetical protein